jgi:aarF domain-containing kinase
VLQDAYITALRPLQDGVPPRSLSEVSKIIEASVGASMAELFESFDPQPVGAASIAQAHRARLASTGEEVVVKVQYPEVAALYEADFLNLERVTAYLMPENLALVKGLRERHQQELDFRTEAQHLRECRSNMQRHDFEPRLCRVPRVSDERLCTQHVLAMEYLEGTSLSDAIYREQEVVAQALGLGSAEELRDRLTASIKSHFSKGGGGASELLSDAESPPNSSSNAGVDESSVTSMVEAVAVVAPVVRAYAVARARVLSLTKVLWNSVARAVSFLCFGQLHPMLYTSQPLTTPSVDLGHVLRVLVQIHGTQMLVDGVYNADPHPGNVLVLPDGRVGLLDYGMVGRLTEVQRKSIAKVVLALAKGEAGKQEVADIYWESGYQACWHSGEPHGVDAVHRFATFHLDRIDLSPVRIGARTLSELTLETTAGSNSSVDVAADSTATTPARPTAVKTMPIIKLLQSTVELSVPDWVEQARRLGGLLIGVSSQTARPISLAREWSPIAERVLSVG